MNFDGTLELRHVRRRTGKHAHHRRQLDLIGGGNGNAGDPSVNTNTPTSSSTGSSSAPTRSSSPSSSATPTSTSSSRAATSSSREEETSTSLSSSRTSSSASATSSNSSSSTSSSSSRSSSSSSTRPTSTSEDDTASSSADGYTRSRYNIGPITSSITAQASSTSAANDDSGGATGMPTGQVIGIVVAGLVGVIALAALVGWALRKYFRTSHGGYDGSDPFGNNHFNSDDFRRRTSVMLPDDDGASMHSMQDTGAGVGAGAAGLGRANTILPGLDREDMRSPRPPTMIQRHYLNVPGPGAPMPMPSFQPGQVIAPPQAYHPDDAYGDYPPPPMRQPSPNPGGMIPLRQPSPAPLDGTGMPYADYPSPPMMRQPSPGLPVYGAPVPLGGPMPYGAPLPSPIPSPSPTPLPNPHDAAAASAAYAANLDRSPSIQSQYATVSRGSPPPHVGGLAPVGEHDYYDEYEYAHDGGSEEVGVARSGTPTDPNPQQYVGSPTEPVPQHYGAPHEGGGLAVRNDDRTRDARKSTASDLGDAYGGM